MNCGLQASRLDSEVGANKVKCTYWSATSGVFLTDFRAYGKSWRLGAKLAPTPMLDSALFAPRRKVGAYARVGAYASLKKTGLRVCLLRYVIFTIPKIGTLRLSEGFVLILYRT
jgi:hypothetical protein